MSCAESELSTSWDAKTLRYRDMGRVSAGSFGGRPSLGAGAARRRAVALCQGAQVASIGDNSSPSNHRLERAVMRLWVGAASAGKEYALASPWTRLRAAAQAHR